MPVVIANVEQGSAAWHKLRLARYGASVLGTVCGLDTFLSQAQLQREKLGLPTGRAPMDELLFDIGHALEPVALKWAARELGETTMRGAVLVQDRGWLLASLDAATPTLEPIDAKVRGAGSPDYASYQDETIPSSTALQLTQQAALLAELTGRWPEAAHVSALLGDRWGYTHRLYRLELTVEWRDRWADDWCRAPGRWHRRYILDGETPPDATMADVAVLVEPTKVQRREATDEELALVEALAAAEAERKVAAAAAADAEKTRNALRDDLARRLGSRATIPGLTWKTRRNHDPILTLEKP